MNPSAVCSFIAKDDSGQIRIGGSTAGLLEMLHPIADKAEISVEFPDKAYIGSFGRNSQFDAYADADSVAIKLVRPGDERREAVMHLHYGLLAEILTELARSLAARKPIDEPHRAELSAAAKQLCTALEPR
jgi:hypothetical protein